MKTQWQVDKAGRVVAELSPRTGGTDTINLTTASSYDAQGRLVQVVEDAGASGNGHLNLTTTYGYDPVGNRLTMTDGRTNTTTVTVDPLNRTNKVQDASNNVVQTQYSPASEVTATINGRGRTNALTLDRLGRVLTQNYLKADGVTAGSLSFTYDPGGLLLSFATADTPTTSVSYDAIGRVQSVAGPSSTSYTYYLDGTVKTVTDLTGTTTFGEDQLGRLASTQDPLNGTTATTTYTVDAGSRLTRRVEASGITTAFSYSALDQLTQKTMTASGGTSPFASWGNTYDLAGNRLSETSVLPGDTYAGTATFTYDTVQRLLTAAQPTQSTLSYGYDAAHNRTSVGGGTAPRGSTSFAYLANEALTTETPTGQSTLAYSPDADGNITADAAGHQLKYDSRNRLQEVRDGTGATVLASYIYDALGRLTKRTAGTAVTQFFYRGLEDQVVQEQDGSNTVLRSYAWDLNGRRLAAQTGGSLYTVATNPHGDLVGLMTGAGSVVGWTHFDPWGQVLGTSGTTIPFGFQGGFTDPLANFVRMGVRWYDPREGRFVTEDPLDSGHRWIYGLDSPLSFVDRSGLCADWGDGGCHQKPAPVSDLRCMFCDLKPGPRAPPLLGVEFQERDSSYRGVYYRAGDLRGEHFVVLSNGPEDDPDELLEPDFADKRVLLEVNATERKESLRELLASIPELTLLRTKTV